MASVLFGGSQSLSQSPLLRQVVCSVLTSGAAVSVGCAIGADAQVIQAALGAGAAARLRVSAAFGSSGAGAFGGSAVQIVSSAALAGAAVSWLAGGALSVPLVGRLIRRSLVALGGCSAAVFFLASPQSSGSLAVAAQAVKRSIPVFVFCASRPAALVGVPGQWSPSSFHGAACWCWCGQAALF